MSSSLRSPCANEELKGKDLSRLVKFFTSGTSKVERTCGQTNEPAHTSLQDMLFQLLKLYGWQNGTRCHYTTLSGSMASYGKHTQTHTSKNHCNSLRLTRRMASKALVKNNCQSSLLPKYSYVYSQLHNCMCVHGHITICLHSIMSPLPSLYPLNHSQN